jgi:hypothetical protein
MPTIKPVKSLTRRQLVFVNELLANGGNATKAYRIAYPTMTNAKAISGAASRLRKHPLVVQALEDAEAVSRQAVVSAVERYRITADRIADAMARLALTEVRQIVDVTTDIDPSTGARQQVMRVRDFTDIDDDAHQAIVEIKRSGSGELTVKLADKRQALMDLARLKGWVQDKPTEATQAVQLIIQR